MNLFIKDLFTGLVFTVCFVIIVYFAIFDAIDDKKIKENLVCDGRIVMSGFKEWVDNSNGSYTLSGSTYIQKKGEICKLERKP